VHPRLQGHADATLHRRATSTGAPSIRRSTCCRRSPGS
jgi:hypothetical protein